MMRSMKNVEDGFKQSQKEYIHNEAVNALMTWEEYATREHPTPYIFTLQQGDKKLVYIGADHSNDPSNPMFGQIEAEFDAAHPDVVFVEGVENLEEIKADSERLSAILEMLKGATEKEMIEKYGESGFGLKLAADAGIDFYSPEPGLENEIALLLKQGFAREHIFAYYTYRQLYQYDRQNVSVSLESYLESGILKDIQKVTQWKDFDYSVDALKKIGTAIWGENGDVYKNIFTHERASPLPNDKVFVTEVTKIAQRVSKFRDEYMINEMGEVLKKYDRPFVIFGASHAYMQRPALESLFVKDK